MSKTKATDEKQADQVAVYAFHHAAEVWWKGIETKLTRLNNLSVFRIPADASQQLAGLAQRSMQLQATLQEGVLMMGDGARTAFAGPIATVQCFRDNALVKKLLNSPGEGRRAGW